jgi:hypothetical protein
MSMALTTPKSRLATVNAILVSARRCASGSFSTPAPGCNWAGLARHKGYTITALVEDLVESAELQAAARLSGKALKTYYDGE